MQPDRSQHTRHRVQLPSGKQIEVVYRDQQQGQTPAEATPIPDSVREPDRLNVCFHCASELAYPLD